MARVLSASLNWILVVPRLALGQRRGGLINHSGGCVCYTAANGDRGGEDELWKE